MIYFQEALNSYAKENDARVAAERLQASLSSELEKSKLEKLDVDQQVTRDLVITCLASLLISSYCFETV